MDNLIRTNSLLTNKPTLEHLATFENFPVFIGCVDNQDKNKDLFKDMVFDICTKTGFIQLRNLLPLDIVYSQYHSEAIGGLWKRHHDSFAEFIIKSSPKNVLEIGGSNGYIASQTLDSINTNWTIIEPNPQNNNDDRIEYINDFFSNNTVLTKPVDTIIHSHVIEHLYEPINFFENISKTLSKKGKHIFSIPNLHSWLEQKFTNTLNFEHTVFLTEEIIDNILEKYGFQIIRKKYFEDHSIFYETINTKKPSIKHKFPNKYNEYKNLYNEFIKYYKVIVDTLNKKTEQHGGEVFLFGAHIFSQFLIQMGLNTSKISLILDNSEIKQSKRLYGSTLHVGKPELIKNKKNVAVILFAGSHTEDIKKQLLELNPEIKLFM